jgi:glycosyltransferase involved in cell wall biosynthesis
MSQPPAAPGAPAVPISVVMAVRNGAEVLPRALDALERSRLPRSQWELVVVDDASTDDSAAIAAGYADVLVRLPGKPRGPAYARNRGSEVSRGALLVFVDADVCVHPDVLDRFAALFSDPALGAAFGSYDDRPPAPGLVSRFRNLLHHHVHQANAGEARTFWAGCGAVRREALVAAGMVNEWHFSRPQIEDIEIGQRLRRRGYTVLLRPEIQGTHLKHWTLKSMVLTDFGSRGVPWMRLLLAQREVGHFHELNLGTRERVFAALTTLALAAIVAGAVAGAWLPVAAGGALAGAVVLGNLRLYALLYRRGGLRLALAGVPLHLLYYLVAMLSALAGYLAHMVVGEPMPSPEVDAAWAVGLRTWPPTPRRPEEHPWSTPPASRRRAE